MNNEKKIAQAILDAQQMHEESYCVATGQYNKEIEDCLIETCEQQDLSENLWSLLSLAMHWWNDIQFWAEDVLAEKNILEEINKEIASCCNECQQVAYPICPINLYFEGDENKCDTSKCNWDTEMRSCTEACKI